MIRAQFIYISLLLSGLFLLTGCVEPFEPETVTFESALVVEATITDELTNQEIFLSRTFDFEDDGADPETNARVTVNDEQGNVFEFVETSPGIYESIGAFQAMDGRSYVLNITTSDGRTYSSSAAQLPPSTQLDSIYAERIILDGQEGIGIFADSFDPTGNSQNYRYTYEETFRIIAPKWTPEDLIGDPEGGCGLLVVPRESEEQTCYRTDKSTDIIQIDTNGFDEDRVSRFLVRFISRENYIISHRYTILVRQLIQSSASYSFYDTLREFSGSQSLFSETQVGFLNGNISSDINDSEKVLGYFDVSTVDERRIFFDYVDFFPGEPLPPFVNACLETAPVLANPGGCVLRPIVENNGVRYFGDNVAGPNEGPFLVVPRVCGDCTVLGSTELPEFWEE